MDAFCYVLPSVGLNRSLSWRTLFQSHHIHIITFFGWRAALVWLVVAHLICPTVSSIAHYCTVSTFHHLSQLVLKMEHFYYLWADNCMWTYSQEGFFSLNLRGILASKQFNITKLVQMIFQCLIWLFWVCWLTPVWYNVDCYQLMSWFNLCQLQLVYLTMEHGLARNLQHRTL